MGLSGPLEVISCNTELGADDTLCYLYRVRGGSWWAHEMWVLGPAGHAGNCMPTSEKVLQPLDLGFERGREIHVGKAIRIPFYKR